EDEDEEDGDGDNDSVDGIYLGKKPAQWPKLGEDVQDKQQGTTSKGPFDISDDTDDDAEMEEIRRKVLASKPFANSDNMDRKPKPHAIPPPRQPQRYKVDSDAEPDSDNGSDDEGDDTFDNIIDATPVTDRVGLAKFEKERSRANIMSRTFSSGTAEAPKRW
ncbi:hypothetical protein PC116_g34870, partial [Phytophthora cactorum]